MNLNDITKKCFILTLFIRDDGQRFLLGSGAYEFKEKQLHFSANSIENDVVSVQGNDGYLLAGQVKRPKVQDFDGFIGDASVSKSQIEIYRRDFFRFFQKNYFYTVVYIFPDGSAIQRRRGFLVDAPQVKELWQLFPEYHVGLNFEDVNYYEYQEDASGDEIYGKLADIRASADRTGGLIWENGENSVAYGEGTDFQMTQTVADNIQSVEIKGDTSQQTYSGKNLYDVNNTTAVSEGISADDEGWITITANNTSGSTIYLNYFTAPLNISTNTQYDVFMEVKNVSGNGNLTVVSNHSSSQFTTNTVVTLSSLQNNKIYKYTKTSKSSFAGATTSLRTYISFNSGVSGSITFRLSVLPTSDISPDDFVYEPYVGGVASPNPDYPQEVQTVTGRQVVTISDGDNQSQSYFIDLLGKNLFDKSEVSTGQYIVESGAIQTDTYNNWAITGYIPIMPAQEYTYQGITQAGAAPYSAYYDKDKNFISTFKQASGSNTITSPNNAYYVRFSLYYSSGSATDINNFQIENGSSASAYESFNPIELCKIGDYQDYIYKSGEDWYIHKETGKIQLDGSEIYSSILSNPTSTDYYYIDTAAFDNLPNTAGYLYQLSNRFQKYGTWFIYNTAVNEEVFSFGGSAGTNRLRFMLKKSRLSAATTSAVKTWFSSNPTDIYYALATPTDTQITDATLITQLEAILGGDSYNGTTAFTVTSNNQLAILRVGVMSQTPAGIIWDNIGATWDGEGAGGAISIQVDSIENVYPVWQINGPAYNPTLTNQTTGTAISYAGNITASQTLKIDMLNRTATLNGTSVIQNISGNWLEFVPGNNMVEYTTSNPDTPASQIMWQEVVG